LYVVAEDFPEARRALGDLASSDAADARALTLMAAIERGEGGSDTVVKGWLARALNAPRGPQWVCDNCHQIHSDWVPVCSSCNSLDTLSWKAPPRTEVASATGTQMLPLIVGAPTEQPAEDIPEAELLDGPDEAETVAPEASDTSDVVEAEVAEDKKAAAS
jgi:HemY protein